ncbi:MAG: hypothetical protein OIF32_07675, partial [Campylobacterales bacterium]|nr:hypothetical protein [Campylobacterales bacterium]
IIEPNIEESISDFYGDSAYYRAKSEDHFTDFNEYEDLKEKFKEDKEREFYEQGEEILEQYSHTIYDFFYSIEQLRYILHEYKKDEKFVNKNSRSYRTLRKIEKYLKEYLYHNPKTTTVSTHLEKLDLIMWLEDRQNHKVNRLLDGIREYSVL